MDLSANFVTGRRRPRARSSTSDSSDDHGQKKPRVDSGPYGDKASSGMIASRELTYEDYTVGWICALPIELAASTAMLDRVHRRLPNIPGDTNTYNLRNIGLHNIVIACLPSGHYGTTNAAVVASNMCRSFPSIRIRFMVGIGGGVPTAVDIRLGDVVVGNDVVQYDFGKTTLGGVFQRSSSLVKPPQMLTTAVANLRARHESQPTEIPMLLSDMIRRSPDMKRYGYPSLSQDRLFLSTYDHDELMDDCGYCDQSQLMDRPLRASKNPEVHYGIIASGNQVIKHGETRDDWAKQNNAICFEMEAAGLVDHFPCLVVRGICDYSDSHKNKQWQPYAAAAAAAYAKELLSIIEVDLPSNVPSNSIDQVSRQGTQMTPLTLNDQHREDLVSSLEFDQIDSRRLTIKKAHSQTCKWFLQNATFIKWSNPEELREHGGFLWIKGKPGAGKSTLMKFLLEKTCKSKKYDTTLDFFFNARGHDLEKSTVGLYRSLLFQLFTKVPTLQTILSSIRRPKSGDQHMWTIELLKELFGQVIECLEKASVACYIDALDECDEDEVRDMISFFENTGQLAMSTGVKFYVCFSSRHYPHITMREGLGLELVLENQDDHSADITKYVNTELKIGNSKLAEDIRSQVQIKASSVFMWAVLVVEILNKERDRGRMHTLRQRLQEIPKDLNELFRQILTRDYQNKEELLLCFQWVLFSRRPLTPNELYFAILSSESNDLPCQDEITPDDIKIFIIESSKGLAEITKSKTPLFSSSMSL